MSGGIDCQYFGCSVARFNLVSPFYSLRGGKQQTLGCALPQIGVRALCVASCLFAETSALCLITSSNENIVFAHFIIQVIL